MTVIQASDDKTVKVILNSEFRSSGTINTPYFDLVTPIKLPPRHTGLCNVEVFIANAPSLFHDDYLANAENLLSFGNNNLWTTQVAGVNIEPLCDTFQRCQLMDMALVSNIANFLLDLVYCCPDFVITFTPVLPLSVDTVVLRCTDPAAPTFSLTGEASTLRYDVYLALQELLNTLVYATFTLSSYTNGVYILRGPWLQCLGVDPVPAQGLPLTCKLTVCGLTYMNINASFGRSVLASNTYSKKLVNSDILWTIPLSREQPNQSIYYTNYSLNGKISYKQSVMEQIEIYFTDRRNLPVMGLTDWTLVLTFDFIEDEEKPPAETSKRARRYLT